MFEPITTKKRMYSLLINNELGNCNPHWHSLQDWIAAGRPCGRSGLVGLRSTKPGGLWTPDVLLKDVESVVAKHYQDGVKVSTMFRNEDYTLHGEWYKDGCYPHGRLYYSTEQIHKREALLKSGKYCEGLTALCFIKTYFNALSYSDFEFLVENYPDHVIEFTCLNHTFGTIEGRNTVLWDVRIF